MPTYRLDVSYDGAPFHGFARQDGVRTVQGDIEGVLERVLRTPVRTVCAGRTDTGVHARRQVMSFVVDEPADPATVARAINGLLGPEVACTGCVLVDDTFDARFSALWRSYRYRVLDAAVADPLRRNTVWHVMDRLDLDAMNRAASGFVGEHDFASFCRRAEGRTTTRTVTEAVWQTAGDEKLFAITATAFCHQMVRSIVGFCVDAGRGRVDPDSVPEVLAARDRSAARPIAPPHGLVLWEVGY